MQPDRVDHLRRPEGHYDMGDDVPAAAQPESLGRDRRQVAPLHVVAPECFLEIREAGPILHVEQ